MTEDAPTSTGQPTVNDTPGTAGGPPSSAAGSVSMQERALVLANERPEVAVGAAFAGGLLFAMSWPRPR